LNGGFRGKQTAKKKAEKTPLGNKKGRERGMGDSDEIKIRKSKGRKGQNPHSMRGGGESDGMTRKKKN